MYRIHTGQSWFDRLIPEGIPTHTSTLISGPGGSGKPLIGNIIAAAWLRQRGSVVFMSLQYPSHEFIVAGLRNVARLDLAEYQDQVAFIELDVTRDGVESTGISRFKANMVKPDIWEEAIDQACSVVPQEGPGILVFGSALNLLLFSPTYGKATLERMKNTIQNDKRHTYLFSVSTTAKKDEIATLEASADNLISSRSEKDPFRLYMHLSRVKDTPFRPEEIEVPIDSAMLEEVKEVADHTRLRVIPLIRKL
jgi:KaiC/GvpD/RAD55 family RecA-like ATPase